MRKKRLTSYEQYERKERFKDGLMDGFMILLCVAPGVVIITTIIKIVLWFRENLALGSDVWSVFHQESFDHGNPAPIQEFVDNVVLKHYLK